MTQFRRTSLWIPILLSTGFLLLTPVIEATHEQLPKPLKFVFYGTGILCLLWAIWLGYQGNTSQPRGVAGHGGAGESKGGAKAVGGDGGNSTGGAGGNGGNAKASGQGSTAIGGKGGSA